MKTPRRSEDIRRALAPEAPELPEDFAANVARLAEATRGERRWRWTDVALAAAFVAMVGVCVAGWRLFVPVPAEPGGGEWLEPLLAVLRAQPWLLVCAAAIGYVQVRIFGRRVRT